MRLINTASPPTPSNCLAHPLSFAVVSRNFDRGASSVIRDIKSGFSALQHPGPPTNLASSWLAVRRSPGRETRKILKLRIIVASACEDRGWLCILLTRLCNVSERSELRALYDTIKSGAEKKVKKKQSEYQTRLQKTCELWDDRWAEVASRHEQEMCARLSIPCTSGQRMKGLLQR